MIYPPEKKTVNESLLKLTKIKISKLSACAIFGWLYNFHNKNVLNSYVLNVFQLHRISPAFVKLLIASQLHNCWEKEGSCWISRSCLLLEQTKCNYWHNGIFFKKKFLANTEFTPKVQKYIISFRDGKLRQTLTWPSVPSPNWAPLIL